MPIYEYECEACGNRFELIQKFSDPPVEICPKCGEPKVRKLMSSPAIQFKGSGFYITDYARKGGDGEKVKSGTDASKPAESKGAESKAGDKSSSDKDKTSSTSSGSSSTSSSADKAPSPPTT